MITVYPALEAVACLQMTFLAGQFPIEKDIARIKSYLAGRKIY